MNVKLCRVGLLMIGAVAAATKAAFCADISSYPFRMYEPCKAGNSFAMCRRQAPVVFPAAAVSAVSAVPEPLDTACDCQPARNLRHVISTGSHVSVFVICYIYLCQLGYQQPMCVAADRL